VISFYGFGCFETSFFVSNMLFDPIIANPVPVLSKQWKIVENPSEDEKWDSQIDTVKILTCNK